MKCLFVLESYTQYQEADHKSGGWIPPKVARHLTRNRIKGKMGNLILEDYNISDDTKSLLIEVQQLVKSLEDAYREAVKQGDEERKLLLYQRIAGRPHLLNIDPELYDGQECVEREISFIIRAKLWIGEVKGLL